MELVSCEHPKRVYNKYIDEYVWTSCGKCNACKKRRASRWVARLERERMCRRYSFFVTLTYDEKNLPLLSICDIDNIQYLVDKTRGFSIPFNELIFSSTADRQYFDKRMALRGIPYASVTDIQKFHKRLNKWFKDNVTKTYKNFRYFTVSEYGSTTLRPHFHSIYFTDSDEVAKHFTQGVSSCWSFGISDCQFVQKSANSYVAQYLNELFDLPSFYEHSKIRPFFVCSKQPPIGGDFYCEEEFEEIFRNTLVTIPRTKYASSTEISDVPLQPCIENRLFPKCRAFGKISHSLRVGVYRICCQNFGSFLSFEHFKWNIFYRLHHGSQIVDKQMSDVDRYLSLICDFSEVGINALKRLYYISKRVVNYCILWKCTVDYYVTKIEEYWSKKELYVLSQFYRFQSSVDNPEELIHCYPEFAFQKANEGCYVLPLNECSNYQRFKLNNAYSVEKTTKSHFKNAYFDSLKDKGSPLFNVLLTYYYAKKCNEIIETFGFSCPK